MCMHIRVYIYIGFHYVTSKLAIYVAMLLSYSNYFVTILLLHKALSFVLNFGIQY